MPVDRTASMLSTPSAPASKAVTATRIDPGLLDAPGSGPRRRRRSRIVGADLARPWRIDQASSPQGRQVGSDFRAPTAGRLSVSRSGAVQRPQQARVRSGRGDRLRGRRARRRQHRSRPVDRHLGWSPFSWPINLAGLPAATIPCGFDADGLPIGLQIVAPMARRGDDLPHRRGLRGGTAWAGVWPESGGSVQS